VLPNAMNNTLVNQKASEADERSCELAQHGVEQVSCRAVLGRQNEHYVSHFPITCLHPVEEITGVHSQTT
jgi:hypothetical protein